ncbi:MAG: serine hydroxymethyltransferase [Anaerolineales bacterium]|nr:serine hydroxymethyltransferase [Chloroflexota bacterium]MBL6979576.1 serine hydroxymethyltransferase [Anaerolineales bacterium]
MSSRQSPEISAHFTESLTQNDPLLADILDREGKRQADQIELIASENIVSRAVLEALGDTITNKTVEGYPGARYHGGAKILDEAERAAIERATDLFGCKYANVQAHSGSQANQAVFVALLKPGDTVMSMALTAGGHLSHGAPPNMSGKWFNAVQYGVDPQSGLLDYDELERLAIEHKPKLIIAGGSAYPRVIDFPFIRSVADRVGATFLVDMAHFAGLVAGGVHPNPIPHAHIVSCTTTKTLRGPRGGLLLTDDPQLAKKIDSSIFPGMQGSLHPNTIAAKAVCLGEALRPSFKDYAGQVVENARALADSLEQRGFGICTGGTDTHIVLVDLKPKGLLGTQSVNFLEDTNITCNKNPIPFDPPNPKQWTGLRLGTAAGTTRGMDAETFTVIGNLIADVLDALVGKDEPDADVVERVRARVAKICQNHPTYQ